MTHPDLFDTTRYPETPGFQATPTSRAAAESVKDRAPTLRDAVLLLLRSAPLTADECAARLEKSILSVRPRVAELNRLGKIYDSGLTRKNASGVSATIWRAFAHG